MEINFFGSPPISETEKRLRSIELTAKVAALALKVLSATLFTVAGVALLHTLPFMLLPLRAGAKAIALQCVVSILTSGITYAFATLYLDQLRAKILCTLQVRID